MSEIHDGARGGHELEMRRVATREDAREVRAELVPEFGKVLVQALLGMGPRRVTVAERWSEPPPEIADFCPGYYEIKATIEPIGR